MHRPAVRMSRLGGTSRRIGGLAATFVLGGLIGPPMADAADVPTAPKLVVLSGEKATFRVRSSDLLELSNPTASATTTLLIANNGTIAQNLSIKAFRSDGSSPAVTFEKVGRIAAGASMAVRVAMPVRPSDGADGYLIIEDSSTSDEAATLPFVVKRSLGFWVLLKPIWGGLVCSAVFFYFLTRRLQREERRSASSSIPERSGSSARAGRPTSWRREPLWRLLPQPAAN